MGWGGLGRIEMTRRPIFISLSKLPSMHRFEASLFDVLVYCWCSFTLWRHLSCGLFLPFVLMSLANQSAAKSTKLSFFQRSPTTKRISTIGKKHLRKIILKISSRQKGLFLTSCWLFVTIFFWKRASSSANFAAHAHAFPAFKSSILAIINNKRAPSFQHAPF